MPEIFQQERIYAMRKYINGVGATELAFSEKNNFVYTSSSKIRVLDSASLEQIEELSSVDRHPSIFISPSEKYVAFLSESGRLRVFEIGYSHKLLLKKTWKDFCSLNLSVKFMCDNETILVPVNKSLCFINIRSGEEKVMQYPTESTIYSVDVFMNRILICYGIYHDGYLTSHVSEYPQGYNSPPITKQVNHRLRSASYTHDGKILILYRDEDKPMIIVNGISDFTSPIQTVSLFIPYYLGYSLSPDGKWFVYNILNDNGSQSAILVYTEEWSEVMRFDNIITASFSSKSNYLLLGARKPFIYQLNENI